MTELELVANQLAQAVSYLDVFGRIEGDKAAQLGHVRTIYRRLTTVVHPDRFYTPAEKAIAQSAFVRLTAFKEAADTALKSDSHTNSPLLATIITKKHTYKVHKVVGGDGVTEWFAVNCETGTPLDLHVAKKPALNSLVANEATVLRKLIVADTDEHYRPYLPDMVDSFAYRQHGVNRRTLAFRSVDGLVSLEAVKARLGHSLHPLDMAWMWRRLLVPIGFAHQNEVVHGMIVPQNIYIQPADHGLVLAGWYTAVMREDGQYPALSAGLAKYKEWYPREVVNKQPVSPATDIAMAAKTMVWLMGGDPQTGAMPGKVAAPFRAFFKGCMLGNQQARPADAWALINEFDELLERLGAPYWPRRFRPFTI